MNHELMVNSTAWVLVHIVVAFLSGTTTVLTTYLTTRAVRKDRNHDLMRCERCRQAMREAEAKVRYLHAAHQAKVR